MRFSLVHGVRSEAQPKLRGVCPACGNETISKCGDIVVHHWAHSKSKECDKWWESESNWHRDWKDLFPKEWQEVVHSDPSGEKHRADVTNNYGWVLEFQNSYLSNTEVKARSRFYGKIIWIINGLKPKNGAEQFNRALELSNFFSRTPATCLVGKSTPSIIKKWIGNEELILIDIGNDSSLFSIHKGSHGVYIVEIPRLFIINAVLDVSVDRLSEFKNKIDLHIINLNNEEKISSRGFLNNISPIIFNIDGTI